ncbi:hypothetical protein [Pseudomonas phage PA1C]|uniref:Uncharacterized protein n=1 Tax=Pseudomonas phage vB_PaeM_PS119XW TaxID=2601632 RepID=A0A5C1K6N2_9CAUD|nr:hypothetical protein PP933_gp059 [Pseudomonas phage vB_PaeM_PS119XW]QBX32210.1 hypothetical protein [Pseudomonas phage PA1C]QEM41788.1 hypothetical protein [Pseudomonas phage vB_PaeM_PS119XW]BEG72698.1 hypothetical protein RVBP21_3260 [Pseudomonas phage BRkr]
MTVSLPTLGTDGWITSMESKADYIISTFLTTNRSMSTLHRTQNTSLQYLLKEYANDILNLEIQLRDVLTNKLRTVFGESAQALVSIVPASPDNPDAFSIQFTGIVTDGTKEYTVGKLVQFQNSHIVNIANINNG